MAKRPRVEPISVRVPVTCVVRTSLRWRLERSWEVYQVYPQKLPQMMILLYQEATFVIVFWYWNSWIFGSFIFRKKKQIDQIGPGGPGHTLIPWAFDLRSFPLQADLRVPGPHTTAPKWEVHIAFLRCQLRFSLQPSTVTSLPSPKSPKS